MTFSFLPAWPPTANPFLLFSVLLLIGVAMGEAARRTRLLPAVAGYLFAGILIGPDVLRLLDAGAVHDLRPLVDIALALVLFELGTRLDLDWLGHDRGLLLTGVWEIAVSFLLMFWVLVSLDMGALSAAFAAAIGVSTSPAVVLLIAKELRAEGQISKRALTLTAMNNVAALVLVTVLLPFLHLELQSSWLIALAHPLYLIVGSIVLAVAIHAVVIGVALLSGKERGPQTVLQLSAILLALGLAKSLNLSVLLCVLALGVLRRNVDRWHAFREVELGWIGHAFFIVLFIFTGASLHWSDIRVVWPLATAFVTARFLGKGLAVLAFGRRSGLSLRQTGLLAFTLTPMAGLAIGLSYEVSDLYPDVGFKMTSVILAAIAALYLAGPVAVWAALKAAGEAQSAERS